MVFKASDSEETGNWNSAGDYARSKIMKHLANIDDYRVIALYGSLDMRDDFFMTPDTKARVRYNALSRLIDMTDMLLGNTKFAVSKKGDPEKLDALHKEIRELKTILSQIHYIVTDERTKSTHFNLDEKAFLTIYNKWCSIYEGILPPLHRANLTFRSIESFDPEDYKKRIKEEFVEAG